MSNRQETKEETKLPALDPASVEVRVGSIYPDPFNEGVFARQKQALGDALGLSKFGVNLLRLAPGVASSQRHWHSGEDEFIYILEGELTLITDGGEQVLTSGMVAGFPANSGDGHVLINRSGRDAVVLEVGNRSSAEVVTYSDIDLKQIKQDGVRTFIHKDGTPY
ncbi:MAG: cupin domain-containing protein [Rhodospirillales bacterium]|nr:cupin domain-containing protein [Rhodospirillales bacterium]